MKLKDAIQEFINLINANNFQAIIVKNQNNEYFTQTTKTIFKGDTRIYGYGSFVNYSINLSVNDIKKHIEMIQIRENIQ